MVFPPKAPQKTLNPPSSAVHSPEGPTGVVTVVFCDTAPLLLLLTLPLVTVPASFPAEQMRNVIPSRQTLAAAGSWRQTLAPMQHGCPQHGRFEVHLQTCGTCVCWRCATPNQHS